MFQQHKNSDHSPTCKTTFTYTLSPQAFVKAARTRGDTEWVHVCKCISLVIQTLARALQTDAASPSGMPACPPLDAHLTLTHSCRDGCCVCASSVFSGLFLRRQEKDQSYASRAKNDLLTVPGVSCCTHANTHSIPSSHARLMETCADCQSEGIQQHMETKFSWGYAFLHHCLYTESDLKSFTTSAGRGINVSKDCFGAPLVSSIWFSHSLSAIFASLLFYLSAANYFKAHSEENGVSNVLLWHFSDNKGHI